MKKEKSFEFLKDPFKKWFEYKADEIYDIGEKAAEIMPKALKISDGAFYDKYIRPIKNLNLIEREIFFKALSYHLAEDYSPLPYVIKYVIKQDKDVMPNALDWLLVHVKNLNLFEFDEDLIGYYKEPINQCIYCGKPDFFLAPPSETKFSFNRKRRFCHELECVEHSGSNTNEHAKACHYYLWTRKKKTLVERMSKAKPKRAVEIFIDFCEKQLIKNLNIEYFIQDCIEPVKKNNKKFEVNKERCLKLTDVAEGMTKEDLSFSVKDIIPKDVQKELERRKYFNSIKASKKPLR